MIKAMKIKTFFCFALFITLLISCNDGILKDSEIKETKKAIIEKGDKYSYSKLLLYYQGKEESEAILPLSFVMAYKYNDADAYYVIYETIIKLYNKSQFDYSLIKNLDIKSREFALTHLIKSAGLGNFGAKKILAKYYDEGVYLPKKSELAKKLLEEIKIQK